MLAEQPLHDQVKEDDTTTLIMVAAMIPAPSLSMAFGAPEPAYRLAAYGIQHYYCYITGKQACMMRTSGNPAHPR